jgi:hypothetical protein
MSGRARLAVIAGVCGAAALIAATVWLTSRSNAAIARWSGIAGVISAGVAVLTLVVTLVPLWRDGRGEAQTRPEAGVPRQKPGIVQEINTHGGSVNALGEGTQINVHVRRPPDERR